MAIQVTNGEVRPALMFCHFFLDRMELLQKPQYDDSIPPSYALKVIYKMYAVDDDGIRHYEEKRRSFEIEDYTKLAMEKAMQGDMDLANAAGAIEIALAQIITDQIPELGEATVV